MAKLEPILPKEEFEITPYILTCASDTEKARYLIKIHLTYYIAGMGTFYFNIVKKYGYEEEAKDFQDKFDKIWEKGSLAELEKLSGTIKYVVNRYQAFD